MAHFYRKNQSWPPQNRAFLCRRRAKTRSDCEEQIAPSQCDCTGDEPRADNELGSPGQIGKGQICESSLGKQPWLFRWFDAGQLWRRMAGIIFHFQFAFPAGAA
jgi:hypothetical protein